MFGVWASIGALAKDNGSPRERTPRDLNRNQVQGTHPLIKPGLIHVDDTDTIADTDADVEHIYGKLSHLLWPALGSRGLPPWDRPSGAPRGQRSHAGGGPPQEAAPDSSTF